MTKLDKPYWIGKRVQIPVYEDRWMMGDRYGVVKNVTMHRVNNKLLLHVMLDKSNKTLKFIADDCNIVGVER
jgi:hypothetical protein